MTDTNITSTLGSTLVGQITLLFIALILIGVVIFMFYLGSLGLSYSKDSEPFEREQTPEEQKQLFKEAEEKVLGDEVTESWNCKNCGGPNNHQFCQYCGRAKE